MNCCMTMDVDGTIHSQLSEGPLLLQGHVVRYLIVIIT